MEKTYKCRDCKHLEQHHNNLWCHVLRKRIYALNLDHEDITCNPAKRKIAVQRYSIKRAQKYPRLESVFGALGYVFNNHYRDLRYKAKKTRDNMTINKHPDGSYKTKDELRAELIELRNKRAAMVHPDVNPDSDITYYNAEMTKVNSAYQRGLEIIANR